MYYRRKILLSILERSKNQTITKLSLQKILDTATRSRVRISAPHQQKRIILFSSCVLVSIGIFCISLFLLILGKE